MNMGWVYSLNHRIAPSLISCVLPRFLAKKYQDLGWHEWPERGGTHPYAHPQHIICQTPYIYITLEYGLGLQPQSPHFTITYQLGVVQISSKIPKAWSA